MKIRYKMILFLFFIVVSIITPISYFTLQDSEKIIIETTFDLCENLSANISEIAREELFIDSTYEASHTVILRLKKSPPRGLIDIKLMNVNGNYVVQFNPDDLNKPNDAVINYVKTHKSLDYIDTNENKKNILRFISPVYLTKKEEIFKIGAAIFDFDKDLLYSPVVKIRTRIIVLSGIVSIVSIFVAIFFSYFFTQSIGTLSEGVKIISDGNYDYQIKIKSQDEIGEFANSFNQMTHNIKMASQAKDEFLANLSHELKTPLTVLYGYAEMLQAGNNDPGDVIEYSKEIHTSTQKLNEYVNDLILLTDIETNITPQMTIVDLKKIVNECLEQHKLLITEKEIVVEMVENENQIWEADYNLLEKAISTIIKNAIVYNNKNGKITIEINYNASLQRMQIQISDTGIGIDSELQEKVFEKFFRIDSSLTYEVSGVGVGLFIAKKIVELHKGEIQMQSVLGKGTKVSIILSSKGSTSDESSVSAVNGGNR